MNEPTIVVIAYNRVHSLQRLLTSLSKADYPSTTINLHISIDASDSNEVAQLAANFNWKYGQKIIDIKEERRGLLKHVLECGELTEKYQSIIVLEDDVLVSPAFYRFAQISNEFYAQEDKIAGVSLFTYPVEENNFYPFEPLQDDSDVHFIQVASSWGQSWSREQWSKFRKWLQEHPNGKPENLPAYIQEWGNNSWKRLFISYMIDTDRYFVFPNTSYSSNFEEDGTHATNTGLFQVNMQLDKKETRFKRLNESNAVYDTYFELLPICLKRLCPWLAPYDFEVDLFGEKPKELFTDFVLTTQKARKAERDFGANMKPLVQNVLYEMEGKGIVLCKKEELLSKEKNRFLYLNTASLQLKQFAEVQKQKHQQVSLILPLLENSMDDFKVTIDSLPKDRFYDFTLVIVCSEGLDVQVGNLIQDLNLNVRVLHSSHAELNELVRFGLLNSTTAYCAWIQAGMQIYPSRIEDVARVFQDMAQIQVLHGMSEEVNEQNLSKVNTAEGRWTIGRVHVKKSEALRIRTELVFWRSSLVSREWIEKMDVGSLFIELLKLNPVYHLVFKLGEYAQVSVVKKLTHAELMKSLDSPEFQPRKGLRTLFLPVFNYWFGRNIPVFRLFYKELEQMPLVIRYDFKNDSFYLSNY